VKVSFLKLVEMQVSWSPQDQSAVFLLRTEIPFLNCAVPQLVYLHAVIEQTYLVIKDILEVSTNLLDCRVSTIYIAKPL
jgi:hypothetical protein